jgi:tRNA-dihydrouridine synthase
MIETYGPRMGVILFRKHLVKYLRGLDRATRLREEVVRAEAAQELLDMLERYRLVLE